MGRCSVFEHFLFWLLRLCTMFELWGRVCVQLLTYEDMSEWKFHIVLTTENGLWDVVNVKRRVSAQIFDIQGVSVCQFSYSRTCLYVTCHLISYVLSRPPCFHTKVSSTRRGHWRVLTLKHGCLHTFWRTKTCLCVTFNMSHRVFHLTSRWCIWNDASTRL